MNDAADSEPRAELTVRQVATVMAWPLRNAQREVARWFARGWPRVRLQPCRGNQRGRYMVDRETFERFCEGDLGEDVAA